MRRTVQVLITLFLLLTQVGCVGKEVIASPFPAEAYDPGLALVHSRIFCCQSSEEQPTELRADVDIHSDHTVIWVPLFHLFRDHGPYTTRVRIEDCSGQYQSIEINELAFEFENGEVVREKVHWKADLPTVVSNDDAAGLPDEELRIQLNQRLNDFPGEYSNGKFTVMGCLIKPNGDRQDFRSTKSVKTNSRFQIRPYFGVVGNWIT